MKRTFLLLVVVCLLAQDVIAEKRVKTKSANNAQGMITFRGITWLEKEENVKTVFDDDDSVKPASYKPIDENTQIDSWYREGRHVFSEERVANGGVILRYSGLSVAGYVADCELSFIYSIENKRINRLTNEALFFKARYEMNDLADAVGAYADLASKLTELYGKPKKKSYADPFMKVENPQGKLWKDKKGAIIWLSMFYNSYSKRYDSVWITYSAPNTEKMIKEMRAQLRKERAEAEASNREKNKDNKEGL